MSKLVLAGVIIRNKQRKTAGGALSTQLARRSVVPTGKTVKTVETTGDVVKPKSNMARNLAIGAGATGLVGGGAYALSGDDKGTPTDASAPVVTPAGDGTATDQSFLAGKGMPSTGSNLADAGIGLAAAGGIYGLYQLLRGKKRAE